MTDDQLGQSSGDEPIRISLQEALAPHVDDLLKRQKSLRGEAGITRSRRAWYYQSWFVQMLVGGVAALAAWAIIEPFFQDQIYVQGKIQSIYTLGGEQNRVAADSSAEVRPRGIIRPVSMIIEDREHGREEQLPQPPDLPKRRPPPGAFLRGSLEIDGERFWFYGGTRTFGAGKSRKISSAAEFKIGQTIGVWSHLVQNYERGDYYLVANFVNLAPPPLKGPKLSISAQQAQRTAAALLLFPTVAGLVGLAIGAADGVICRLARRALLGGAVGLLVGFIGGFVSHFIASLVYLPLTHLAMQQQQGEGAVSLTAMGFAIQIIGRSLAWMVAGSTMGLGQGIALRSGRILLYGLLGGLIGGLLGGLLFDPIDLILLGRDRPDAYWSRMAGLLVIGGTVGAMIGVVELLARDAWLRMVQGPLAGKEFLIFKDLMKIGASSRSDIYLFNDPLVAPHHASLRTVGEDCELEAAAAGAPVEVNGHPCRRTRLRHGDRITVGRASFVFEKRGN